MSHVRLGLELDGDGARLAVGSDDGELDGAADAGVLHRVDERRHRRDLVGVEADHLVADLEPGALTGRAVDDLAHLGAAVTAVEHQANPGAALTGERRQGGQGNQQQRSEDFSHSCPWSGATGRSSHCCRGWRPRQAARNEPCICSTSQRPAGSMVSDEPDARQRARNPPILLRPTCRIFDFIRLPSDPVVTMMNKREALRFEKVFPVILSSDDFGECNAMARNISAGGILVEISEPLPLGTQVRVHFWMPDSQASIIARGEVKNHYFLNFSDPDGEARSLTGMAIRFTEFEAETDSVLGLGLTRMRILH
jgi:hypothetical protein